jgi:MFS family permease
VTQAELTGGGTRDAAESGLRTGIVALLALAVFINYVDRGNLATAAPLMRSEMNLSNTEIGMLLGAFFWVYTPGQLLAGWLAEKINAYRTLAIGVALWSLATIATGFATGFATVLALRLVLGLGESAAFPCSSKLFGEHLPPHRLGFANGMVGVGLALGPAFGTFGGGLLMANLGWRPVFILFGLVSLLWLVPWFAMTRQASRHADKPKATTAPSYLAVLRQRAAWGACLGHFAGNYAFYFVILWLPLYLVNARGFSVGQMAVIGGVIYVVYAISAQLTGFASDYWMRAGASATLVRKSFAVTSHLGGATSLLICTLGGPALSVAGLFLAAICFGFGTPTIFAIGQTLAGPRAAGKWIAVQNCIGNLAGVVAPAVTGFMVDRTGQFTPAFLIAGAVSLLGVLGWGVIIRRVEPVDWSEPGSIGSGAMLG